MPRSLLFVRVRLLLYLYSGFKLLSVACYVSIGMLKPILELCLFTVNLFVFLYYCFHSCLLMITLTRSEILGLAPRAAQPC